MGEPGAGGISLRAKDGWGDWGTGSTRFLKNAGRSTGGTATHAENKSALSPRGTKSPGDWNGAWGTVMEALMFFSYILRTTIVSVKIVLDIVRNV